MTLPNPVFDLSDWDTPARPDPPSAGERLTSWLVQAAAADRLPGAVVWAEHLPSGRSQSWVVGQRACGPRPEAMTWDTVFDVASLTKGVVTATLLAQLMDDGRLPVDQAVSDLWPWRPGTAPDDADDPLRGITVRHLLTHSSGLEACLPLAPAWSGLEAAQALARASRPSHPPGTHFRYSDINFILAQGLIERVTGQALDVLAQARVLGPCGMTRSTFRPLDHGVPVADVAPTERVETGEGAEDGAGEVSGDEPADACVQGQAVKGAEAPHAGPPASGLPWLRGTVHDPVCRRMGGVGGHAGLFSTAADLARYARMLLRSGVSDSGLQVMSASAVARMTAPASPPGLPRRSLGWDIDSPYARARGRVHGVRSFGHTAFTGCALWIDPEAQCFTLLLSNRVHTAPSRSIVDLYEAAATLGASAVQG